MAFDDETHPVELPGLVVECIESRLPSTEWDEPAEFITYVLEEVLFEIEMETQDDDFESIDEAEVKDRLRLLGYLGE